MANWYYYNKNGEKIGPISATVLKELASQGLVTQETKVENGNGRTALAGSVNGLTFAETKQSVTVPPVETEIYGMTSSAFPSPADGFDFPALTSEGHTPNDYDPFANATPATPQAPVPSASSKLPAVLKKPIVFIPLSCFGLGLIIFVIIGIVGAIVVREEGHNAEATGRSASAIEVHAFGLMYVYNANEVAADKKYKGKILIVEGTIDSIGKDIRDLPYVTLKTRSTRTSLFFIQCFFSKKDEGTLSSLHKNQSIFIQGKCAGAMGNVILNNCSIVE